MIYERLRELRPRLVLHGGARGADDLADRACRRLGIPTNVKPPLYAVYGAKAPLRRTDALLDEDPDLVLAFWDGESPGTAYALGEAARRGIPAEVVYG